MGLVQEVELRLEAASRARLAAAMKAAGHQGGDELSKEIAAMTGPAAEKLARKIEAELKGAAQKSEAALKAAIQKGTDPALPVRNITAIERAMVRLRGVATQTGTAIGTAMVGLKGMASTLGAAMGGILRNPVAQLFGVAGVGAAASAIVQTNIQYEKLIAQLFTLTGSAQGAKAAFQEMEKAALLTPFQIEELTASYIRLRSLGIIPTQKDIALLADFASAKGGRIDDLVMAATAAAFGEQERLKQFHVQAQIQGNRIRLVYGDMAFDVERNAKSVYEALLKISAAKFAGAAAREAKTLGGALSNLQDATASFSRALGEAGLNAALRDVALSLGKFTNELNQPNTTSVFAAWIDFFRDLGYWSEKVALTLDRTAAQLGRIGATAGLRMGAADREHAAADAAQAKLDALETRHDAAVRNRQLERAGGAGGSTLGALYAKLARDEPLTAPEAALLGRLQQGAAPPPLLATPATPGTLEEQKAAAKKASQARWLEASANLAPSGDPRMMFDQGSGTWRYRTTGDKDEAGNLIRGGIDPGSFLSRQAGVGLPGMKPFVGQEGMPDIARQIGESLKGIELRNSIAANVGAALADIAKDPPPLMLSGWADVWESLSHSTQNIAAGMVDAFSGAFSMLREEGATLGNFFEGMGKSIFKSLAQSVSAYAGSKVVENVRKGMEDLADATSYTAAALGTGNLVAAAGAVMAKKAAQQHFLVAAGWAALGGGAAVAGGMGSTSSGGLGSGYRTGAGTRESIESERRGATINITIDGIDPLNPRHGDLVIATMAGAVERHGGDVFVNGRKA